MHFQASTPNWHPALLAMPDGAVVKAFDGGLLREAKQTWAAAGRDPARLITVLRHYDVFTAPEGSYAEALAHWRAMYARWADATFFDRYAPYVDIVSESNEYSAWSTWTDARETRKALYNVAAAAEVWNSDYRGQRGVSDDCRVALLASPVGNGWPREITQIAVDTDSYLDYHAYCYAPDGRRAADCWRNHSGLWHFIEHEHGLRPRWLFGESGPYRDAQMGWRHPLCLGGDVEKLVAVMSAWWRDVATTPAYREGRIAGPGCWFTSGNVGWEWYQLDAGPLLRLAQACRPLWALGEYIEMDAVKIAGWARQILAEATGNWWEQWAAGPLDPTLHRAKSVDASLPLYRSPAVPPFETRIVNPETYILNCHERQGEWLRVTGGATVIWCKATDCRPA